ncbi:MAG: SEC-C metal-binding domain-containing protein, partial [Dehalococcoidia bacterium]
LAPLAAPQPQAPRRVQESGPATEGAAPAPAASRAAAAGSAVAVDARASAATVRKVGRNDPCPCGSGKKSKKCCGSGGVAV